MFLSINLSEIHHGLLRLVVLIAFLFHWNVSLSAQATPGEKLNTALREIKADYRVGKCEQFGKASRVIISLLAFDRVTESEALNHSDQRFFEVGSDTFARILDEVEVAGEDRAKFLGNLVTVLQKRSFETGSLCHFPTHGIQMVTDRIEGSLKAEVIFQTTISLHCNNLVFPYPFPFDYDAIATTESLTSQLLSIMPYPEDEMRRFDDWKVSPARDGPK